MNKRPLRVNDFFCGAGGMALGFKQAGWRLAGAWDFDKDAVESYGCNVSPRVKRMDITQMNADNIPLADAWAYGFPCVDISNSGQKAGMVKGQTRSGLFYEVMRLLAEVDAVDPERKPRVIMAENVKAVRKWLPEIEREYNAAGYRMYAQLQNSWPWGVPQKRERYFIVGVRDDIQQDFVFPDMPDEPVVSVSVILEPHVDAKYFVRDLASLKILERVGDAIKVKEATKAGFTFAYPGDVINVAHPNSKTRRGRVGRGVANTVMTNCEQMVVLDDLSVRYLTPREIARLQGFPDSYTFEVSEPKTYKQLGNAVTVPVAKAMAQALEAFLRSTEHALSDEQNDEAAFLESMASALKRAPSELEADRPEGVGERVQLSATLAEQWANRLRSIAKRLKTE